MMQTILILCLIGQASLYAQTSPKCIAHRGYNKLFLENSTQAIEESIIVGAHGTEYDVRHTFDQVPILMHDKSLRRTARSKSGKYCDLKTDIKYLKYADIKNNCELLNGEEIPLLKDILAFFSDLDAYQFIEFKDKPTIETLEMIEKYNFHKPEYLRMISFKKKYLDFADSRLTKSFWDLVQYMKLYAFIPFGKHPYGVDMSYFFSFLHKWVKKKGKETSVWTVDTERRMLKLKKRGTDFITTNDPVLCLKTLW